MRINAHCHVFNLQSVFTQGTKDILKDRLERSLKDFSFLLQPLLDLLDEAMQGRGIPLKAPESERAKAICKALDAGKDPKEAKLRADLHEVLRGTDQRGLNALCSICDTLESAFGLSLWDPYFTQVSDFVEFISVAFASSMDDVTDYLFDCMAEGQDQGYVDRGDLIITPLMMDILSRDWSQHPNPLPPEAKKELGVFDGQRENTLRQCLRYPGRVLPFYAINPWRPEWLSLFQEAMEDGGFVGMKAYPSLGYRVKEITEALRYCNDKGIPVMTHCNDGGFKARDHYANYCEPTEWQNVIDQNGLDRLRICFGHSGGDEAFKSGHTHSLWHAHIVSLMLRGTPEVYADISYHTGGMAFFSPQRRYFRWLEAMLEPATGPLASRILFGTDYFLSLMRLSEDEYWKFFKENLTERQFERITRKNPAAFLGLDPQHPDNSAGNITQHIDWLRRKREEGLWATDAKPANWLRNADGF